MLVTLTCPAQNDRSPKYMEKALAAIHQGLAANERIVLSDRDTARVLELLENPPEPTPALIAAARGFHEQTGE